MSGNLVGQIYDLFNQALRGVDLLMRAKECIHQESGSILTNKNISQIRNIFSQALINEFTSSQQLHHLQKILAY